MCEKKGGRENAPKRRRKMIISSILAVVVFAVMFIMAARDKLSRPAGSLGSAGAMTRC